MLLLRLMMMLHLLVTSGKSYRYLSGPDSLVVRASASGAVDRGFAPRSRHTKGIKNGTSSSLADARIKRVVLGDKVR